MTSRGFGPRKGGGRAGSNDTSCGSSPESESSGIDPQPYTQNTPNGKGKMSVPLNKRSKR